MSMTQIQRDAMERAQRGDWALADAMELIHRMEQDIDICGGYRVGGRLRYLIEGDVQQVACDECNGTGQCECEACNGSGCVDCGTCSGSGEVNSDADKPVICSTCYGDGEVACKLCDEGTVECQGCTGEGVYDGEDGDTTRIVDLNGDELWNEFSDEDEPFPGEFIGRSWADAAMASYHADLAKAAQAQADETAANLKPAQQVTLLPEHA